MYIYIYIYIIHAINDRLSFYYAVNFDKTQQTGQDKTSTTKASSAERPLVASPDRTTSVTRTQSALEGNLSILSLPGVDLGTLPLTHVVKDARGQPQSRLQREFVLHTFERPN